MTDGDALLAAILANPDDDTPRLVYADWLQENGDADRAEFIRLQCGHAGDDEAAEERVAELEERHRGKWLAGLPQFPWAHWFFRRGFPDSLEIPTDLFLERYDRFAAVPWVRALTLTRFHSLVARDFANRTWSPRWVELEVNGHGYGAPPVVRTVAAVAGTLQARQLRSLWFTSFEFDAIAVEALAASPYLDGLRVLGVPGDRNRPLYAPLRARFRERLVGEEE